MTHIAKRFDNKINSRKRVKKKRRGREKYKEVGICRGVSNGIDPFNKLRDKSLN